MSMKVNSAPTFTCWTCFKKVNLTKWIHKKEGVTYSMCSEKCFNIFSKCVENGVPKGGPFKEREGMPHTFVLTIIGDKK